MRLERTGFPWSRDCRNARGQTGKGSERGRGAVRGLRKDGLSRGVKDSVGRGRLRGGGPDS